MNKLVGWPSRSSRTKSAHQARSGSGQTLARWPPSLISHSFSRTHARPHLVIPPARPMHRNCCSRPAVGDSGAAAHWRGPACSASLDSLPAPAPAPHALAPWSPTPLLQTPASSGYSGHCHSSQRNGPPSIYTTTPPDYPSASSDGCSESSLWLGFQSADAAVLRRSPDAMSRLPALPQPSVVPCYQALLRPCAPLRLTLAATTPVLTVWRVLVLLRWRLVAAWRR
jgi:hypothetical protein